MTQNLPPDPLARWTAAAVFLVAVIAAVVSYTHLYHLAVTHGEGRFDAVLIPVSIDGTVVTGSLLMLRARRANRPTPWLARAMLVSAVVMTVAANVAFGWSSAVWGVLMAGWPAAAFLLNAEGAIGFGRQAQAEPGSVPARVPLPSHRQIRDRYACGPDTAKKIRAAMASVNGDGSRD